MENKLEPAPLPASFKSPVSNGLLKSTIEHTQSTDTASEKKQTTNAMRQLTVDQIASTYWLFEILCILLSLACLIAVSTVLHSFDGRVVPTWRYGITLNTIVSLLASVATFALIVPITACLSQLKWLWFRGHRSLIDFEMMEDASRGLFGSIALLLRWKGGWLACYGAFLTIMMLAISPFVQQIVKSGTRTVRYSEASIPIANTYNLSGVAAQMNMDAAIMTGLLTTKPSLNQFVVQPVCATGNCSWPIYQSLAICGSCTEVTNKLTLTYMPSPDSHDMLHVFTLPNNISLSADPVYSSEVSLLVNNTQLLASSQLSDSPSLSIAYVNHKSTLVDVFVILGNSTWASKISNTNVSIDRPYAAECILEFCAQNYTAAAKNGAFHEATNGPALRNLSISSPDLVTTFYYKDGVNYTLHSPSVGSLSAYLSATMQGFQGGIEPGPDYPGEIWSAYENIVPNLPVYERLNNPPHNLDAMFNNLAQSMTLALRTQVGSALQAPGESLAQQVIVRIDWAWISLPFALLVLVLLFLLIVALATRRAGLQPWKGSSIAILFHGLRHGDEYRSLIRQDSMLDAATKVQATLRMGDAGPFLEKVIG